MRITTTERLTIDQARSIDAPFIYELMNSPGWIQFIGDRGIRSLEDAENYIQNSLINSYKKNGYGLYKMCLKETGTPIGLCGFLQRDYLDAPDIGFAILPNYEGRGLVFEAASSMLEIARNNPKFEIIHAITTLDNEKSQHLLMKLGLRKRKQIKQNGIELLLFSNEI